MSDSLFAVLVLTLHLHLLQPNQPRSSRKLFTSYCHFFSSSFLILKSVLLFIVYLFHIVKSSAAIPGLSAEKLSALRKKREAVK